MFDLRHLEHSTIIYEARRPLLRLAWNRQDPNYIAALAMDVQEVIILDVRVPCTPVAKLSNHRAAGKKDIKSLFRFFVNNLFLLTVCKLQITVCPDRFSDRIF